MRYAVPQFIDVEDKIFGPLTWKQAVYVAGGGGVVFAIYMLGGFFWAILLGAPFGILAAALAFVKINNRPFIFVVYAAVYYYASKHLYLWKKSEPKPSQQAQAEPQQSAKTSEAMAPKLSQSRLKELAWSLDTKESMYTGKEQWK